VSGGKFNPSIHDSPADTFFADFNLNPNLYFDMVSNSLCLNLEVKMKIDWAYLRKG
jgi:hypothetical protein